MSGARVTFSARNLREFKAKLNAWRELFGADPTVWAQGTYREKDGELCFLWGCRARVIDAGRTGVVISLDTEGTSKAAWENGLTFVFEQ